MLIRFAKGRQNDEKKPHAMTCVRDDGTCTWMKSDDFFVCHDLIHYAVETTLGYTEAFFGLLAGGRDIDSFGTKNGTKDVYTREEGWAESLVGLLQLSAVGTPLSDAETREMLIKACVDSGHPAPQVTLEQLARMRAEMRALHRRWAQLPAGESLELMF